MIPSKHHSQLSIRCLLPHDRFVATCPGDIDTSISIWPLLVTDPSLMVKVVDEKGAVSLLNCEELGERFGFEYLHQLIYFHEREFREAVLLGDTDEANVYYVPDNSPELFQYILSPDSYIIKYIDDNMGFGMFAESPIDVGTFIGEYTGMIKKRFDGTCGSYCLSYPSNGYDACYEVDAKDFGNSMRFINHADNDDENVSFTPMYVGSLMHVFVKSVRLINTGEQLLANYGKGYWLHNESAMRSATS